MLRTYCNLYNDQKKAMYVCTYIWVHVYDLVGLGFRSVIWHEALISNLDDCPLTSIRYLHHHLFEPLIKDKAFGTFFTRHMYGH